ncbi:MAG: lipopolysaccharide heptosyltransferase II [Candidatus Aminicenantales bacterium]
MKIVVRMPNWIGDAVLSLPVFEALKASFPEAEIWAAARPKIKALFSPGHAVKGIIDLPDVRNLKSLRQGSALLKAHRFDAGLLLTNSFASALLFYAAGIRERWGYAGDGRKMLLTRAVSRRNEEGFPSRHQRDYYLDLVSGLGFKPASPVIDLHLSAAEKDAAANMLDDAGWDPAKPLIIFNPGAAFGPAKRWPADRFAALAGMFQERMNAEILVVGSAEDAPAAAVIAAALRTPPISLVGKTSLRELMGLISLGRLFVTNDTGPMHVASALGVPVVAVFGPTDPLVTGPLRKPAAVLRKDVPCRPCLYRSCPYDHRCMTRIDPEDVFAAGRGLL